MIYEDYLLIYLIITVTTNAVGIVGEVFDFERV